MLDLSKLLDGYPLIETVLAACVAMFTLYFMIQGERQRRASAKTAVADYPRPVDSSVYVGGLNDKIVEMLRVLVKQAERIEARTEHERNLANDMKTIAEKQLYQLETINDNLHRSPRR